MMFLNTEMELKTFSPEDHFRNWQQENDLKQEYTKLLASGRFLLRMGTYPFPDHAF